MHLADGVLPAPVVVATLVAGAAMLALGSRALDARRLPPAALLAAALFVASAVHVPVGVGSVHLMLNGVAGLLLGAAVFPVFFVGLLLQAALLGFGGFGVLGANLLVLGLPALLAHALLRGIVRTRPRTAGALAGVLGAGLSAALAATLLASAGSTLAEAGWLLAAAHLPVMAIDACVGAAIVATLARWRPQALPQPRARGTAPLPGRSAA